MYSAHGAQDPYRSGSALVDVTNSSLDCADLSDKTFNGQVGVLSRVNRIRRTRRWRAMV